MNVHFNVISTYYQYPKDNAGQVLLPNKFNSGQMLPADFVNKKKLK